MKASFLGALCFAGVLGCTTGGHVPGSDAGVDDGSKGGVDGTITLSGLDSDKDGLPDEAEAVVGTDPNNPDSDGDGLQDGAEFKLGCDPLKADSDGDGVNDSDEVAAGTDPSRADTDLDGFSDGDEALAQTDPNAPFQWPFGGQAWPDLRNYSEGTYGTGFEIGDVIPNFEIIDQFDQSLEFYQFHDYVILLDFSAGWCNPCRDAAEVAQTLWEDYRDEGFIVVHYLTETSSGLPANQGFQEGWATQYGLSFPVVRQDQSALFETFKLSDTYFGSLPFMILLDRDMRINSRFGANSDAQVRAKVQTLLTQGTGDLLGQHPKDQFGDVDNASICDVDGDGKKNFSCGGDDCVDTDKDIYPGADEDCEDSDHNCDGRIHLGAADAAPYYRDADRDGFGDPSVSALLCAPLWPFVTDNTDCNDEDEGIHPETLWYLDSDNDGAGDPNTSVQSCEPPEGYVGNAQDPDDTDPAASGCWQSVSVGRNFTCGLKLNGRISCWGLVDPADDDEHGQVSDAPTDDGYVQMSAGLYHGCGLKADGSVHCWGFNKFGATEPPQGVAFTKIECGLHLCCGLTGESGDNVVCWGDDTDGRATPPPGTFQTLDPFGWFHLCGLTTQGQMLCWGTEKGKSNSPSPTVVPPGTYTAIAAGHYFSCAIDEAGALDCWGEDAHDQASPPPGSYQAVQGGVVHGCGLKTDGTIACWGSSSFDRTASPPGTFSQLDVNQLHSCALGVDGLIKCWGWAEQGSTVPNGCAD